MWIWITSYEIMHCPLWWQEKSRGDKQIYGSEWESDAMKFRDEMLLLKAWFCMIIEIYWKIEISWKCKNEKCTKYLLVFKEAKSAY